VSWPSPAVRGPTRLHFGYLDTEGGKCAFAASARSYTQIGDSGHRANPSSAMMAQNRVLHSRMSAWSPNQPRPECFLSKGTSALYC
jgi:hypothetical protein